MTDNNDFFNKGEEKTETIETPIDTKIKVGEEEYTQDELSKLVGLGKIGIEAEEKYDTRIDRIWPEFTKKTQAEKDYLAKIQELESKQPKEEIQEGALTPEQKAEAKAQLEDLMGGKIMTQKEFDNLYLQRREAEKLIEDIDAVVEEAKEEGTPKTSRQALLDHISETGIRNPKKAYKDMFEAELDKIKEQKLKEIKPSPYQTTEGSAAGAKTPAPVKVTDDNLGDLLKTHFSKG